VSAANSFDHFGQLDCGVGGNMEVELLSSKRQDGLEGTVFGIAVPVNRRSDVRLRDWSLRTLPLPATLTDCVFIEMNHEVAECFCARPKCMEPFTGFGELCVARDCADSFPENDYLPNGDDDEENRAKEPLPGFVSRAVP
jgi:hypothetical protein